MIVNGNNKEIHLSFYELINKMRYNPPKKIYLMTDLPEEQRYCTYDEENMVYRQDYNDSILGIPLGVEDIYIDSVKVLDEFDPLKTIYEIGEDKDVNTTD